MDQHGTTKGQHPEEEKHPPRWVPYTPPAPDGWDRVRLILGRLAFPAVVLLLALGVGAVYYYGVPFGSSGSEQDGTPNQTVTLDRASEQQEASRSARSRLTVRSSPSGATVRLNGDSVGVTPLRNRSLNDGAYMLSLRAAGYFRSDTVLVLDGGADASVNLTLRPRASLSESESVTSDGDERGVRPDAPVDGPGARETAPAEVRSETAPSPDPAPAVGALYVSSTPSGATVSVDGRQRGTTPLAISRISAGSKEVTLALDTYQTWSERVEVTADSTRRVQVTLEKRTGRLRVLARPWGTIYVDGDVLVRESDVWYEVQLPIGRHDVTVVHPALGQKTRQVQIRPGEETSVVIDLQGEGEGSSSG